MSAIADLGTDDEFLAIRGEGLDFGDLFQFDGADHERVTAEFTLTQAQLAAMAADGTVSFTVSPSAAVGAEQANELTIELFYPAGNPPGDVYRFTLQAGQSATLALAALAEANVELELQDAAGATIAVGGGQSTNLDRVISNFAAPTTGTYYILVDGGPEVDYTLVITRGADFDSEPNNGPGYGAQDLTLTGSVLGAIFSDTTSVTDSEDFLSRTLGPQWTTYSSTLAGRTHVTDAFGAASGRLALLMDTTDSGDNLNEAIWTVDLSGANDASLSFSHAEWGDQETNFQGDFSGHFEADGVAISDDGIRWHPIFSPAGQSAGVWQRKTFDLAAKAAEAGMTLGPDFKIKFQQFGRLWLTLRGRGYDRIVLTRSDPPDDFHRVEAIAGDLLQIAASIPAAAPGEPRNVLEPAIELVDPTGAIVAGGLDGALSHEATVSGSYTVRVWGEHDTLGEYVLSVDGHTGPPAVFQVATTDPTDGARLPVAPVQITVQFNGPIRLDTLEAADLTVDGVPAVGVSVVDVDAAVFLLPPLAEGVHHVSIEAGAINDLQGTPLAALASTLTIDTTGLRLVGSSVLEGDIVPAGAFTFEARFDEPLDTTNIELLDVQLVGQATGAHLPASLDYDETTATLVVHYAHVPDDDYTLTIREAIPRIATESEPNDDGVLGATVVAFALADDLSGSFVPVAEGEYQAVVSGRINTYREWDFFKIVASPGDVLEVAIDAIGGVRGDAPDLRLFDETGRELAEVRSSSSLTALLVFSDFTYMGDYYIVADWGSGPFYSPDPYTLTATLITEDLLSPGLTDLVGNNLDGEAEPATTVPSGDGNAGGDFVVHFSADATVSAMPTPLVAVSPLGSLIYEQTAAATSSSVGDSDSFTLPVDGGQTITVLIEPEAALRAEVTLVGPAGDTLSVTAAADMPGNDVMLGPVPATAGGEYTVTVGGVGGTTGPYSVRVILNAALEHEEHGGPSNDGAAGAQDIDASFIPLGSPAVERGAVLGALPNFIAGGDDFESGSLGPQWSTFSSDTRGRIQVIGSQGAASGELALILDTSSSGRNVNEAVLTVDLAGVTDATLSFFHAEWNDIEKEFSGDFEGSFEADGVAISDDGVRWHPIFNPPDQPRGDWRPYTFDLAAEAATAGMTLGAGFQIKFQQFQFSRTSEGGRGYDEIVVKAPVPSEDWYRLTLDEGQSAALALTLLTPGSAELELYDSDLNLLTEGQIVEDAAVFDQSQTQRGDVHFPNVLRFDFTDAPPPSGGGCCP